MPDTDSTIAAEPDTPPPKVSTGVDGLDAILHGGLPRFYPYLLQGETGTGKTTLALQFAQKGIQSGETVLYIALSESEQSIRGTAQSHGWSLDGMHVHDASAMLEPDQRSEHQTIFHTSEIELEELTDNLQDVIERVEPDRVVLDSISEIRMLAQSSSRYRRQMMALAESLSVLNCTTLLLRQTTPDSEKPLQSLIHGVIELEMQTPEYGTVRRRLQVRKVRGMDFSTGYHNFRIQTGGLDVFPQLQRAAPPSLSDAEPDRIKSGMEGLDALLGGGLRAGSSALFVGPTGTGKSTLVSAYARQEALQGRNALVILFDEPEVIFYQRLRSVGLLDDTTVDDALLRVEHVSTADISVGELSHRICAAVDAADTRLVVIDGLRGYLQAMPVPQHVLVAHLHDLLTYLARRNVLTLLTATQHGIASDEIDDPVQLSYLSDAVVLLRYFEGTGRLRRAVSVVKKRYGSHEHTLRELYLSDGGPRLGPALDSLRGIFRRMPSFEGDDESLIHDAPPSNDQ